MTDPTQAEVKSARSIEADPAPCSETPDQLQRRHFGLGGMKDNTSSAGETEVLAGMKAYGPAHPDYPNAPRDWDGGNVLMQDGTQSLGGFLTSSDWMHGSGDDIIAYPSTSVQGAGEAGENLARRFHEAYERLAPSFGYETRAETRSFDPDSANGRLMIAVCSELSTQPAPASVADEARAREVLAEHAERYGYPLAAASIRKNDDPWFYTVCARAMLAFAARPAGEGERLAEAAKLLADRADAVQEISGGTVQHSDMLVATIAVRAALATEGTRS